MKMVNKHAAFATTGRSVMICEHTHARTQRADGKRKTRDQEVGTESRNYGANLKYEEITHNTVDENESICHRELSTAITSTPTPHPTDSHDAMNGADARIIVYHRSLFLWSNANISY